MRESIAEFLERSGASRIGQVSIRRFESGYVCTHIDDSEIPLAELEAFHDPFDARNIALLDEKGEYRPLKTAPTLKRGWSLQLSDAKALQLALDCLYPAAAGMWRSHLEGNLHPVPLRETLDRQTGMYRVAATIQDDAANELVASLCAKENCIRHVLWPLDSEQSTPITTSHVENSGEIPLVCVEACCLLVAEARRVAKKARKENS